MINKTILLFFILLQASFIGFSQAGIAVTPGRVFYNVGKNNTNTQTIKVTNPTNIQLEIGVSISDWNYQPSGNNNIVEAGSLETSCADWLTILPNTYFLLEPKETKEIEIEMKVPSVAEDSIPVRTAMVFFTQLNPSDSQDNEGASIQVTVRMGVKIYHSFNETDQPELDIIDLKNFTDDVGNKRIEVSVNNGSKIWTSGDVTWELFNKNTGKKYKLGETEFHTLPGDTRVLSTKLPEDIDKGNYTATVTLLYGDSDIISIAELDFMID